MFDLSKVLTPVDAFNLPEKRLGWTSKELSWLKTDMQEQLPYWVRYDDVDEDFPFVAEGRRNGRYFHPAPYPYLQHRWMRDNGVEVGTKVHLNEQAAKQKFVSADTIFEITKIEENCLHLDSGLKVKYNELEMVYESK
jgi:hypothetical protein